jgi:c(7)-type cytochrome triheme protein
MRLRVSSRISEEHSASRNAAIVATAILCLSGLGITRNWKNLSAPGREMQPEITVAEQESKVDFSHFYHTNPNHARLPCLLCHRRESGSLRPVLPGGAQHVPCSGCHAKEFANSNSPVCAICHTSPPGKALKPFPSLKSFNVRFDHSLHLRSTAASATCVKCHRSSKGGVALSIPAGLNAHGICYQCHGPHAQVNGRDISSCGTCHQLGNPRRTSEKADAFRVGFSHAKHGASQGMKCNDCHNVRAGMPQMRQVSSPVPLNHHAPPRSQSCMTCHNGQRAFGGDDFSVCKRCHNGPTWRF